jgi:lipopolysaccharide transport system permease protein
MNASAETKSVVSAGERAEGPALETHPLRLALIWTLVRTDFKVRYHGSLGGFVWALGKPLTMFVMLMLVFSFLFASEPNYKLNLIVGLFLWDFFAEGTKSSLISLDTRGYLLTKTRCPAWVLVVTSLSNALIALSVFVVVIIGFLTWAGHPPTVVSVLLFLTYCAALVLIVVGFALATSVLFLRYRDLNQVWDMVAQAGFFLAPIIYPLSILPERFHIYLYLWAPTSVIEFSRMVLVGGTRPTVTAHAMLAGAVTLALVVGSLVYRRLAPRAAEYL